MVSARVEPRAKGVYASDMNRKFAESPSIDIKTCAPKMLPHMNAIGIAKLTPGILCDGLTTTWNDQEHLLWSRFNYTDDTASVEVLEFAQSLKPCKVEAYMSSPFARQQLQLSGVAHRVGHGFLCCS